MMVRGVNISLVPGVTRYSNGTMETGSLRLVGVWSGQALTLTQPPRPADYGSSVLDNSCAATSPTTDAQVLQRVQSLVSAWNGLEQHGIALMSVGPCGEPLDLQVAVADARTIDYLTRLYGPVNLVGWLNPAGG